MRHCNQDRLETQHGTHHHIVDSTWGSLLAVVGGGKARTGGEDLVAVGVTFIVLTTAARDTIRGFSICQTHASAVVVSGTGRRGSVTRRTIRCDTIVCTILQTFGDIGKSADVDEAENSLNVSP